MAMLIYTGCFLGAYVAMELVAWLAHKYLMHGPLWFLHRDHHQREPGFFERNDAFFLLFAIPSWLSIMGGMIYSTLPVVFVGLGIAGYGVTYFLLHDIFIHQRFQLFRRSDHPYFQAIRKAHKVHHKHLNKENGECFGMLLVPKKYYQERSSGSK